ncbi:hypothetical protein CAPTEDRAFT_198492 [Capitella teleta]|uniref:BTB domain-containing protein n=1 Tax=Capitella teleta TaxID=283909 RepID=R7ULL6_CAPTE|nr:hypothetical protein CAPTEDRAFT_198492 [Capitella teleta]|eukprot:ELU04832.1 hypothetical protein CAPTEDRAFT_198492 [Capitella teleta]
MTQEMSSLPASFLQMREAGELVDITLVFGDQHIPCHKVILAGRCDYFHRMFLTNMIEKDSTQVVMKEISARTGALLVGYLYTGRLDISLDNAQDLLSASAMLLLGALKQDVEEFLSGHTGPNNCVSIMNLASLYEMKTLLANAKKFLHEHTKEVMGTDEIRLLQEVDLLEVLGKNSCQEDNFRFVQKWVNSADGRTDRFYDLLQHVTLSKCSKEFICSTVMEERLMVSVNGMKLIQQAMQASRQTDPIGQQLLVVGDVNGDMWLCPDINLQAWQSLQGPPSMSSYYSACASPGGFFVSGGYLNGIYKSDCSSYHAQDRQWKALPPMPTARGYHSSIYHDECLYIVGGITGQNYLDSVEKLDMRSLQWSRLPSLPHATCYVYLAIVDNKLFVLGKSGGVWNIHVHEFDLTQQTWRQRSAMPEKCVDGAAVSFNDHVYVVGGKDRSCLQFNPLQNTWISLERPQLTHHIGKSLVWNGNILVCGGRNSDVIEAYSPGENKWSSWSLKMPTKKAENHFALKMQR